LSCSDKPLGFCDNLSGEGAKEGFQPSDDEIPVTGFRDRHGFAAGDLRPARTDGRLRSAVLSTQCPWNTEVAAFPSETPQALALTNGQ
jgi:hypothetical protein